VSFSEAMTRAERNPGDATAVMLLAKVALEEGQEARAIPPVKAAAETVRNNAQLWQWLGLLYRGLDEHALAIPAFNAAAMLGPQDAKIALGRAQTAMEAGLDAEALYRAAIQIAPGDGDALLSLAAARLQRGDGEAAMAELAAIVEANPGWTTGHEQLARLRFILGQKDVAMASFDRALAVQPGNEALWQSLILTLMAADRYAETLPVIDRARRMLGNSVFLDANEAVVHSETGAVAQADGLYAKLAGLDDVSFAVRHVRHLLRTGRAEAALPLIDHWTSHPEGRLMWPYASLAWRMTGDPRWQWMEGDPRLVGTYDLTAKLPPLDRLAEVLRGMHRANDQHLDQSVRGGTQTDGPLFSRIEPEIRQLRAAIVDAVRGHVAQLPMRDPRHPTLAPRRDRTPRFSGSWSVRLGGSGRHANHIHPLGWFSSALYVALPEGREGHEGWLTLGAPQESLGLDLPPVRMIEPKPGRLVLFPSTMWHGTVPFASGERLTVAFDVAPPR
jgi:tetratricopeptide (TPR) repeat protein